MNLKLIEKYVMAADEKIPDSDPGCFYDQRDARIWLLHLLWP